MSRITAPRGRRDQADPGWKLGNRAFARRVEQALGRELALQLLERELERAVSLRLDQLDHKLIFPARFEDVDAPSRQDRHTVLRLEFYVPQRGPEAHAPQLRFFVFQREIAMPAGGKPASRNLARPPRYRQTRCRAVL